MSTTPKTKRKLPDKDTDDSDELDLFAKLTTHDSDDASDDGDSTDEDYDSDDSDESVISGLDEEEESSGDEDVLMDEDEDEESEEDDGSEDAKDEDSEADESDKDINEKEISSKSKKLLKKLSKDKESSSKNETSDIVNNNTEEPSTSSSKPATSSQITKQSRKAKKLSKKSAEEGSKSADSSKSNGSSESVSVKTPGEYDFDSSDEEDLRNTVGNIPMQWYREYEHIGYNLLGKKIIKPASGDQLDNFLNKMDNPDYWRTVVDKTTGQSVVISDKDAEMIKRLRRGKYSDANYDPYQPWVDFFTHEKMLHPLTNHPATKASFIPSKWERLKVGRMVHAIKMGWMKPKTEKKDDEEENEDDMQNFYMLWNKDDQSDITKRYLSHIPAPKLKLPGHEESYNPPPEYLPTEEEMLAWKDQDPEDRRLNFLPQKFSSLRQVRAYERFINERFERCLDLYLCPRQRKLRMNVNPEDLLPKLPKPRDLQPFPTVQALVYRGHTDLVRCISPDPTGQWLVSGSDDQTLRLWEVTTGRCMKTLQMGGVVRGVTWNPNASVCLVAAIVEDSVIIINPGLGDKLVISSTDTLLDASQEHAGTSNSDQAEWQTCTGTEHEEGFRMRIKHKKTLGQVTWQARGDYLAVVIPGGDTKSVLIHQISRQRSQNPFRKSKGLVQCVLFHPTRPFFFVATQRYVRVYNLLKQELSKKLMTNVKWVSSMAVHSGGDNVIIGSYDCRLSWFDLDLSTKPYQTLRHHKKAIRQVCYHKKYPLFASASDDGSLIICHGRVYNDLLQNPLIVPVKVLRGHNVKNNLGVLDCAFHPTQPWVFSSGGDGTIRLFS